MTLAILNPRSRCIHGGILMEANSCVLGGAGVGVAKGDQPSAVLIYKKNNNSNKLHFLFSALKTYCSKCNSNLHVYNSTKYTIVCVLKNMLYAEVHFVCKLLLHNLYSLYVMSPLPLSSLKKPGYVSTGQTQHFIISPFCRLF